MLTIKRVAVGGRQEPETMASPHDCYIDAASN